MQLSNQFIQILNFSINKALNTDPQKEHILSLTQYKSLSVSVSDWNLDFVMAPSKDKISVTDLSVEQSSEKTIDCSISGKLFDLIKLSAQEDAQVLIQSDLIQQTGDLHVLQNYKKAMAAFEISLPEYLSQALGPNISHLIMTPFKAFNQWFGDALKSTRKDVTEYAQEESRIFPPKEEIEDFFDEIQETKLALDRAEATLKKFIEVQKKLAGEP